MARGQRGAGRVNEDTERPREGDIGAEVNGRRSGAAVTGRGSDECEDGTQ